MYNFKSTFLYDLISWTVVFNFHFICYVAIFFITCVIDMNDMLSLLSYILVCKKTGN